MAKLDSGFFFSPSPQSSPTSRLRIKLRRAWRGRGRVRKGAFVGFAMTSVAKLEILDYESRITNHGLPPAPPRLWPFLPRSHVLPLPSSPAPMLLCSHAPSGFRRGMRGSIRAHCTPIRGTRCSMSGFNENNFE